MTVFTLSQARQNFAAVLDRAIREGQVLIRRRDGSVFSIQPQDPDLSPLDVKGVATKLTAKDIVGFVRQSRRHAAVPRP